MEPSLTVSLYGTKGDAENLELKLYVLHKGEFLHSDLRKILHKILEHFSPFIILQEGENCNE